MTQIEALREELRKVEEQREAAERSNRELRETIEKQKEQLSSISSDGDKTKETVVEVMIPSPRKRLVSVETVGDRYDEEEDDSLLWPDQSGTYVVRITETSLSKKVTQSNQIQIRRRLCTCHLDKSHTKS